MKRISLFGGDLAALLGNVPWLCPRRCDAGAGNPSPAPSRAPVPPVPQPFPPVSALEQEVPQPVQEIPQFVQEVPPPGTGMVAPPPASSGYGLEASLTGRIHGRYRWRRRGAFSSERHRCRR